MTKETLANKERIVGIAAISLLIFCIPAIFALITKIISFIFLGKSASLVPGKKIWSGFIFFGILSIGILRRSNKIRLIAVAIMSGMAIAGPLGLLIGTLLSLKRNMLVEVIRRVGMLKVVVMPWVTIIIFSLVYGYIVFYLTRSRIRKEFK